MVTFGAGSFVSFFDVAAFWAGVFGLEFHGLCLLSLSFRVVGVESPEEIGVTRFLFSWEVIDLSIHFYPAR